MRFKITIRGNGVELRGYIDGEHADLNAFAGAVKPWMVVASPAADDFNPFGITEPEHPPTLEASIDILTGIAASSGNMVEVIENFAALHFGQANVIRGERYQREQAEAELRDRELHHFETEETLTKIKATIDNWDDETNEPTQGALIEAIRGVLQ